MNLKYSFLNDYSKGAHPRILQALSESNDSQELGYGEDAYSTEASSLIKEQIKNPHASVHFVSGGTQANQVVLASLLKPYEAVIAAESAHINVHEAGAIEATGHKVLTSYNRGKRDGKVTSEIIEEIISLHSDEHMVKPKVVYISNSTEIGTIYSKKELTELSELCKKYKLYLFLDGARLGSALTSKVSDLTLSEIASLVDVFYIGGTKNGALFGEAIVINNQNLQSDFRFHLKQRGALLAKGRVLGVQFRELFKDNLYFDLARYANDMADLLKKGISELGYTFLTDSPTNQIFPILPNDIIEKLKEQFLFYVWEPIDENRSAIRLVTSWATQENVVNNFLMQLQNLHK